MAEDMAIRPEGEEPRYPSVTDLMNKAQSDMQHSHIKAHDPYRKAKVTPYPSESLGFSEYYGRSAYKRLGFNPFEDNRLNYSQNTTTWEKIKDTGSAFWDMTKDNMSVFGIGGHSDGGQYQAERYERQAALAAPIGDNSTFGWFLKQAGQAGYTASIITSIAVEEALLGAGTALTGGGLAGAAWARTAHNIKRLLRIGDVTGDANKAKKIYDAQEFTRQTASRVKQMKELNDVGKARQLWNKLKSTREVLDKAATVVTPHASEFVKGLRAADSELNKMNGFAKAFQGFGAFYREVREANLAFQEAGLEQSFVEKDAMQRLTEAYKAEHEGKEPVGEDLQRIQEMAQRSGASTYWMNTGLIYTTNKIGLGMMFGKYAPILSKENITNTKFGQFRINKANLRKGRFASSDFIKSGLWNQTKDVFKKSTLRKDPMRGVKYAAGWLATGASEGTQEYFQEVIQDAEVQRAENEFMKGSRGNIWDVYATSMNKLLSAQGAEVFMSGFLMGGIATPYRVGIEQLTRASGALTDYLSGNYKKNKDYKRATQEGYAQRVNKTNEMFKNAWAKETGLGGLSRYEDYMDLKQRQDDAIENQDEKAFRDVKDEATLEVINNSIENGTFNVLMDQMEQVQNLTDEEIASTFQDQLGDNPTEEQITAFREDTRQIVDRAKQIKKMKEHVDKNFTNPYSFGSNDEEVDDEFGLTERQKWAVFERAKRNIIKNQYSYARTLERQDAIMQNLVGNPPFWNKKKTGPASDYTVLFNPTDLKNEIALLKRETKLLSEATGLTPEELKERKDKLDKLEKLVDYQKLITELTKAYASEEVLQDKGVPNTGATVTLNTRAGGEATVIGESDTKYKVKRTDNGRTYWINKDNVNLNKVGTEGSDKMVKELYKSFEDYMKSLGKANDNQVKDDDLASAFDTLLDFYALKQDGVNLTQSLNTLMNPKGFEGQVAREAALEKAKWENMKDKIADDLAASIKARENSTFLRILADKHNVFIPEDDLQAIFESADEHSEEMLLKSDQEVFAYVLREVLPRQVYDVNTLKPIKPESQRFRGVVDETIEYLNKRWDRNQVQEEEVVEETAAPTAQPTAAPTQPVEKREPVTLETPFEEWPEELRLAAESARDTHIDNINERRDLQEAEKKQIIKNVSNMDNFLKMEIAEMMLRQTLNDWNRKNVAAQPFEEFAEPTTRAEQEDGGTLPNMEDAPASEEILAPEDAPTTPPVSTEYYTEQEQEILQEAGITSDTVNDQSIPSIDLNLDPQMETNIKEGSINYFIIGTRKSETEVITNALQGAGQISDYKLDKPTAKNIMFKTSIGDTEYVVIYDGKKIANEVGTVDEIAMMLGLPTAPSEMYSIPLNTDTNTYYVKDNSQLNWITENKGRKHVFKIVKMPTEAEMEVSAESGDLGSWEQTVTDMLNATQTKAEFTRVYNEIVALNIGRQTQGLDSLTINQLADINEQLAKRFPTKSKKYKIGENYQMKGKLSNFGVAIIMKINKQGVVFKSHITDEVSEPIPFKEISDVVQSQIMDIEQELENQKANLTSEEEKIAKANKETSSEALDDVARHSSMADDIDNMTDEELENLDDEFFDNLGCE